MRRLAAVIALVLLIVTSPATVRAAGLLDPEKVPPSRIDLQDKSQEDDCDCCQKCKAAQRSVLPQHEEGPDRKDGCDECCDRCGRTLPAQPQESPPDIIDKPKK